MSKKNLSRYVHSYDNITLPGDFDMTPEDKNLQNFTDTFSLEHLINQPTCSQRKHPHKNLFNSNWNIFFRIKDLNDNKFSKKIKAFFFG